MEDEAVKDDAYSDDDLDALPVNAFQELQEDAFRSTQQPRGDVLQNISSIQRPAPAEMCGSFDRLSVGLDAAAHLQRPQEPSSDYGDFDDEMLDGEIFDGAEQFAANARTGSAFPLGERTQREQWRQQRYGLPPQATPYEAKQHVPRQVNSGPLSRTSVGCVGNAAQSMQVQPMSSKAPGGASTDVDSLQAEVQRLLRERDALQRAVQHAEGSACAKAGEIAIVRAKISKAEQEFESRTKAQQRLHADESARYRIEVEKARAEIQNISTEKAFLENELAEGTKQLREVQKMTKKGGDTSSGIKGLVRESLFATPKKNKNLPYADGFNDDEVQILSPSKLALRGKAGTPRAGGKRKRKSTEGSPIQPQPLELAEPVRHDVLSKVLQEELSSKPTISNEKQRHWDANFQFSQKLLNHRLERGEERIIEALSQFRLPSQPEKALSTVLYDQILALDGGGETENFPAAVGLIVISLWSQCLKERYHSPVHLLIDLVEFIILVTPLKTAPELTNSLMELVQETADIIVIPRCQKKPPRQDSAKITSLACLRVIQMMAQDCSIDTEEITRFWRTMRFDFTMMLLSFLHPIEELHITVDLLRTSVLKNSFAMIIPPGDGKQDASEAHVIDNLSRLLVEAPRPAQGEPFLDAVQLSELRLEILELLDAMCERKYSAEALAKHRLVIGRLVRVMNDELDRAYDYQYGHGQHIALVNAATNLLYFLTSTYASSIDIQARLSAVPGGEKKFLIALTRLAFSEGCFLEEGIKDEVVDEAHQMLEMRVSPEEADQLVGAFASAQSTRRGSKEPR